MTTTNLDLPFMQTGIFRLAARAQAEGKGLQFAKDRLLEQKPRGASLDAVSIILDMLTICAQDEVMDGVAQELCSHDADYETDWLESIAEAAEAQDITYEEARGRCIEAILEEDKHLHIKLAHRSELENRYQISVRNDCAMAILRLHAEGYKFVCPSAYHLTSRDGLARLCLAEEIEVATPTTTGGLASLLYANMAIAIHNGTGGNSIAIEIEK